MTTLRTEQEVRKLIKQEVRKILNVLFSSSPRWTEDLEELKRKRVRLLGDCLLAAAFLSYLGAFSWDFRQEMLRDEWEKDVVEREIPLSQPFKVLLLCSNFFNTDSQGTKQIVRIREVSVLLRYPY